MICHLGVIVKQSNLTFLQINDGSKIKEVIKILGTTFQFRYQNLTHKIYCFYISYNITFTLTAPKKKKKNPEGA